jgi:predicted transcriptional regulator
MIYNHISTYPGVSFSVIKSLFNLTDGTLRYHLNYLESKHEIRSHLEGRNKCYYPVEELVLGKDSESKLQNYKLTVPQERILNIIRRNPWITQKDLIIKCGLKGFTVKYNLKKLIGYGVVQKKENGRNTCYNFISDDALKSEVLKQLVVKLLDKEIDEHTFLKLKRKLE